VIETILAGDQQVYGVNTGFGLLKDIRIPRRQAGTSCSST